MAFPIAPAHLFEVMRGVTGYASRHGRWLLTTHGESANLPIQRLRGWRGDGIIAILTSGADARAARQFMCNGVPVVTFSATLSRVGVPRVRTDSAAIGSVAAEHLLEQGYREFGLYGLKDVAYSTDRGRAFGERLASEGLTFSSLLSPSTFTTTRPWENEVKFLIRWLRTLALPVGIFAVNDYRAQLLTSACKASDLRIPHDIGVIGADNNHVICEFTSPRLTSVDCNWHRVGEMAAEMLDRLMNGRPAPSSDWLVEPIGVIQRESTALVSTKDTALLAAVTFIRDHISELFGVERLLIAAKLPRRTLELRFWREFGCSPYLYLCRERVRRAKDLLRATPEITLSEVAQRCGFRDARRLREVFTRTEGVGPSAFRRAIPCLVGKG